MKKLDRRPFLSDDSRLLQKKLTELFTDISEVVNELVDQSMNKASHSPAITADTLVKTGTCTYRGYTVTTATAGGTIDIRDGVAAGGGVVIETIPASTTVGARDRSVGVICNNGIFVDYNGATGTVVIQYEN